MTHPCQFTPAILDEIGVVINELRLPVHDPFAGTGERLGALCDRLGLTFTGTEIEGPFIVDRRVRCGDSTEADTYPAHDHVAVTSPVYPNGMTDSFAWKSDSKWEWKTYRHARARIVGADQPLHPNNMGAYGNRHRRSERSEQAHFDIAWRCVRWWPEWVVVNVKDVNASTYEVSVVDTWRQILEAHLYEVVDTITVPCPGQRHGANRHLRADHEVVLVCRKGTP